ncbi:hypothetical protein F400_gp007 [Bacillus phage BCD7]|uniref:Uncharacterized protein n=1 Tax=Bacillus phage BCD7 TaxID=1136534 RepID=J9PV52_9CAUD|nr:hypothetical protein F400_gp007 [Bacillus phage BCD7]AEZ50454.1 hypothetical protein BCD7_0007 [Bacillus phage BCD7]
MKVREMSNRQLMSKVKNCALGIGNISPEEILELEVRLGIRTHLKDNDALDHKGYMLMANGSVINTRGTQTGRLSSSSPNISGIAQAREDYQNHLINTKSTENL